MVTRPDVKLNLGLNVLRKREDGYHDLETLFIPYDGIHDTLEIIPGDGISETSAKLFAGYDHSASIRQAITEDGKVMVTIARKEGVDWDPLKDLTVKAYQLLDKEFDLGPVKIFLEKTSPVGAGLGGGSADAAYALKMLDGLFSLNLDRETLAGFAARLGSDCAFFIYDCPMFGEGRGEILSPYPIELPYHVEVVVPEGISVSTAEAYGGIVPSVPELRLRDVLALPVGEWKDRLVNDFETTVFRKHPELAAVKKSLYESGAVYASMSGSGSALFALYG